MNYLKPEIVLSERAVQMIQGTKPTGTFCDVDPTKNQTQFAYESDE